MLKSKQKSARTSLASACDGTIQNNVRNGVECINTTFISYILNVDQLIYTHELSKNDFANKTKTVSLGDGSSSEYTKELLDLEPHFVYSIILVNEGQLAPQ